MPVCSKCPPRTQCCYECNDCIKKPDPQAFLIQGGRLEYFCSGGCRIEIELNK